MEVEQINTLRELTRVLERNLDMLSKTDRCYCGITLLQCHALVEIGREQGIGLKRLAGILDVDISTLSKSVDGLVVKELVDRSQSKEDRRSISLALSNKGIELFNTIEKNMLHKFTGVYKRMDLEVSKQVILALENYNKAIEAYNEEEDRHE